jgi:hypothetical protein
LTERNLTLLRQFKQPINGEGEPYDAGCNCAIEELLALSHETFPGLRACVVTNWVLAGLDVSAQMVDRLFQVSLSGSDILGCSEHVMPCTLMTFSKWRSSHFIHLHYRN